jgi:hypothetical protein
MFRELMAIMTSQMMTSRSLICLLGNQNGGKLQKRYYHVFYYYYLLSPLTGIQYYTSITTKYWQAN